MPVEVVTIAVSVIGLLGSEGLADDLNPEINGDQREGQEDADLGFAPLHANPERNANQREAEARE